MTVSYVMDRHVEGGWISPVTQADVAVGKTVVETPYGFGVIESVTPGFGLVKVLLLERDFSSVKQNASVSLPWDRIRVLPETIAPPSDICMESRAKRALEE